MKAQTPNNGQLALRIASNIVEYELDRVGVKLIEVPPEWLAADLLVGRRAGELPNECFNLSGVAA